MLAVWITGHATPYAKIYKRICQPANGAVEQTGWHSYEYTHPEEICSHYIYKLYQASCSTLSLFVLSRSRSLLALPLLSLNHFNSASFNIMVLTSFAIVSDILKLRNILFLVTYLLYSIFFLLKGFSATKSFFNVQNRPRWFEMTFSIVEKNYISHSYWWTTCDCFRVHASTLFSWHFTLVFDFYMSV